MTDIRTDDIDVFVAAVRRRLDDLEPDTVDELTSGLAADLADERAESGSVSSTPDASAYADELRASAGLAPRTATRRTRAATARSSLVAWRAELTRAIRSNRVGSGALDLLLALRPAWWVLRAWLGWELIATLVLRESFRILPHGISSWVLLLALVLVSAQWGRARWLPRRGGGTLVAVVSVVAVLALAPVGIAALVSEDAADAVPADAYSLPQGLTEDGSPVGNVFAYDSAGRPLTGIQLFDQDGEPLDLAKDGTTGDGRGVLVRAQGASGWNVVPLRRRRLDDEGRPLETRDVPPPFASVQPLATPLPTPSGTASSVPSTPSESAAPTPSTGASAPTSAPPTAP